MNWTTECAVVVPCLNEVACIEGVVQNIRRFIPTVFVIDDGSADDTGKVAKKAGAQVLQHKRRRGKGAALQTGWKHAHEQGFKWALAMDGDGQHSSDDIVKFFQAAERTGTQLIVGNRMDRPDGMPRVRRWVNRWMSKRISALAGKPLPDSQCGFRLMNLKTWAALAPTANHFEIESDVLLAFAVSGCGIEFVPIEVIYRAEQSKIHPVRDTLRWFRWWWRAHDRLAKELPLPAFRKPALPVRFERG